jgi:redox-sensitive bicupin YhaK (pirin superfamily)
MTWFESEEPAVSTCSEAAVELIIEARALMLDTVAIGRVLPTARRRMVGPFIFFDEMGPVDLPPGVGMDVLPHPHINLATVTYLFEGEILHRDSLGSLQAIRPGEVNWMTAGRGIAHSERTPEGRRATGGTMHGIQLWVALPREREEDEPTFDHYPASVLPVLEFGGATIRLLAGRGWGISSPVRTWSPTLYADITVGAGGSVRIPADYEERAVYIVDGAVGCGKEAFEAKRLLVLAPGSTPQLHAHRDARLILLGGAPFPEKRHIWWNFVSSSKARIEQAKVDWAEGRFGRVVGDEAETIPLP